jgi:hypothetical protein
MFLCCFHLAYIFVYCIHFVTLLRALCASHAACESHACAGTTRFCVAYLARCCVLSDGEAMTAVMMTMAVLLLLMMMTAIVFNYCRYYYYYEEAARALKQRLALASAAVCCTSHYPCEQPRNKRTHGKFESSCLSIIVALNPTSCPKQTDPLLPSKTASSPVKLPKLLTSLPVCRSRAASLCRATRGAGGCGESAAMHRRCNAGGVISFFGATAERDE